MISNAPKPICPHCIVEMVIGYSLPTDQRPQGVCTGFGVGHLVVTAENLKLVSVWKCPSCGHSENIKGDK